MSETRNRRSVRATEVGTERLRKAQASKLNHNGKRWTYQDLADKAGLTSKTVQRFLTQQKPIDYSSALAICQALGVELIDVTDASNKPDQADRDTNLTVEDQHHMDQWIHLDEYLVSELSNSSILKSEVINFCQKWLNDV